MQQPQGEVQWQTMTDNPLSDKGMDKTMGERLALLRRRLGLSQRRAAELSGLTHYIDQSAPGIRMTMEGGGRWSNPVARSDGGP